MKTFTRTAFSYWGDRIGILMLFLGMGALSAYGGFVTQGARAATAGPMPIIGIPLGIALLIGGIIFFFRPQPMKVEIDEKEVRVLFHPYKLVRIPRKDVIGAKHYGIGGQSAAGIEYWNNGIGRRVVIRQHYRDDRGKLFQRSTKELCKALNTALGIQDDFMRKSNLGKKRV